MTTRYRFDLFISILGLLSLWYTVGFSFFWNKSMMPCMCCQCSSQPFSMSIKVLNCKLELAHQRKDKYGPVILSLRWESGDGWLKKHTVRAIFKPLSWQHVRHRSDYCFHFFVILKYIAATFTNVQLMSVSEHHRYLNCFSPEFSQVTPLSGLTPAIFPCQWNQLWA